MPTILVNTGILGRFATTPSSEGVRSAKLVYKSGAYSPFFISGPSNGPKNRPDFYVFISQVLTLKRCTYFKFPVPDPIFG